MPTVVEYKTGRYFYNFKCRKEVIVRIWDYFILLCNQIECEDYRFYFKLD